MGAFQFFSFSAPPSAHGTTAGGYKYPGYMTVVLHLHLLSLILSPTHKHQSLLLTLTPDPKSRTRTYPYINTMSGKYPKQNELGGDSEMSGAGSTGALSNVSTVSTGGAGPGSADLASFARASASGGYGSAGKSARETYGFAALKIGSNQTADTNKVQQSTGAGGSNSGMREGGSAADSGVQSEFKRGKKRGPEESDGGSSDAPPKRRQFMKRGTYELADGTLKELLGPEDDEDDDDDGVEFVSEYDLDGNKIRKGD